MKKLPPERSLDLTRVMPADEFYIPPEPPDPMGKVEIYRKIQASLDRIQREILDVIEETLNPKSP